MLSYCLNCRKETEIKKPEVKKRIMLLSRCAVSGSKKFKFIKKQEASLLLS